MSDPTSLPIDELEVSVRTQELLASLGVTTVGQLLALPEIRIPDGVPTKIAKLMRAELGLVLDALGVEYPGNIVGPAPIDAQHIATGDVAARWQTISTWLRQHQPRAAEQFNPPASADAIRMVEEKLGVALPDDYKAFLALANGQAEFAPMVGLGALLPIESVAACKQDILDEETPVDAERVGEGVRAVSYSRGWIPITRSARGRDYLCIDLDPASTGVRGQIVEYVADDDSRPRIAASFADLLSLYFIQAQTGEIDFGSEDEEE